ncbi:glycosyltransferase family 4 protein [Gracilimonas sp.]|uniref:glycosyltransferase family 4 protein n=1 Tax=Gracilimonas sp. TaxID=1974203 RepID=UPI003BA9397C
MKVLWVTNGYPTKNHPEYCVFTKDQIEAVKNEGIVGEIYFINAREYGYKAYLRAYRDVKNIISAKDFDLIHCFHGLAFLLVFCCLPKKPLIVSFLNSIENEYRETHKVLEVTLVLITKLILRTNERIGIIVKDRLPFYLAKRKYSYHLPNGVDTSDFFEIEENKAKEKLGLSLEKKYILFVSSKDIHRKQKRYDRFKEVLQILRTKYSISSIEELTISNVPRDQLIFYYNASSLHLITSDFEGSPNSVKESISCNTPVVSTDVGNVKEMINNIPNCKVAEINQSEVLADLVYEVLNTKDKKIRSYIFDNNLDSRSKSLELIGIYRDLIT